ncbi:MAG TPA: hypothetical protein VF273_04460 [Pelobium sp.]
MLGALVEIFSTNVTDQHHADCLLAQLKLYFPDYEINFDLDDCDNILRIKSNDATIEIAGIVEFLGKLGVIAKVFVDECG